ncbi:hypothetical protein RHSIM_Rhsim11G0177200 [Rhododendron simsii]|uniref:phenylalanine--tRNA ligase n=1 Tax=Rhododendron simsii TaxID=118357 RepID=A0A834G873_RHOSS|nr:hypothetical protein RHSIM_Rhsim11G0177200 [Rhododendron simsii]
MAEEAVLGFLEKNEEISDSGQFAADRGIDHQELTNIIKRLSGFRFVDAQDIKRESWILTEEGKTYAAAGSPEMQVFHAIPPPGISLQELQRKLDPSVFKIGCSQAKKNQWVEMGKQLVTRKVDNVDDKVKDLLNRVQDGEAIDPKELDALKRRKLIVPQFRETSPQSLALNDADCSLEKLSRVIIACGMATILIVDHFLFTFLLRTWKGYSVRKGPNYAPKRKIFTTDLTRDNLLRGDWKDLEFKEYNFSAKGQPIEGGHLHPLLKAGFEEMPTNNFVESSFWNFDALFQPQQHPARDSHDTFFLQVPSTTKTLPEDYVERVKRVHESGGYGSRGYAYEWKREEANKNLLRTHTTAVSSRMLYLLGQQKKFTPKKYFSIDRVFRNEAVDRTHLAEFHQIEGLVCDRGLSLGDLIGVLNNFFLRLGMSKLKFKPAYNPYTEPSMEIFSYHEGLKKWVEIGNSGMFRPEMLRPMGLPEDVRVIAWGLSLERPTMILYGVDNIRDLFGHKVDLSLIKKNPLCRLGME